MDQPRLYHELAAWWPLMSAPEEYAEEAAFYLEQLTAASTVPLREVLELGSGGGNNASHLKAHFGMTLVEPAAGMLEVSRALNPDCEHVQGDMRTVRLERQFDAVFVHDAVCYMTTEADLRLAIETASCIASPAAWSCSVPTTPARTFVRRPTTADTTALMAGVCATLNGHGILTRMTQRT